MAKMLRVEELILGLKEVDADLGAYLERRMIDFAHEVAKHARDKFAVETSAEIELFDGEINIAVGPTTPDQLMPKALEDFDPEGEWMELTNPIGPGI